VLDPKKFDDLMATDFTSRYDESYECFSELTSKAAAILEAEAVYIFILNGKEHTLQTFLADDQGNSVIVSKPLDRGITACALTETRGIRINDVSSSSQWTTELDDFFGLRTVSYLAWPLVDFSVTEAIGVVEFRNKKAGDGLFDTADSQMARIVAFQLSRAIVHYRQQVLLAGRNEAINMAYEKNFDSSESISLDSTSIDKVVASSSPTSLTKSSLSKFHLLQRSAFVLAPSWNWKQSGNNGELFKRRWDYDVFLHSKEELTMHAIDVFDERGLFTRFSIPMATFVNFLNEIIAGYNGDAPYHNHFHAFDVMHICYLLITKCRADEYLESFNILSILVAALAHDLGHDGFNNAFHAATESEMAIVYNGVSILENYSAAFLFRILRKEKCNLFARLSKDDMTKMRMMV